MVHRLTLLLGLEMLIIKSTVGVGVLQTDDVVLMHFHSVPAHRIRVQFWLKVLHITNLIVKDATTLILQDALLDAMVVACTASVRLPNASVMIDWLRTRLNTLVPIELRCTVIDAVLTNLIHSTYVLLVDALLRKATLRTSRGALPAQWTLLVLRVSVD